MIKKLNRSCNVAIIFVALLVTPLSFSLEGCSTTGTSASSQTSDQILLNAEKTTALARDTMTLFVHLEGKNHDLLMTVSPEIYKYAEFIRQNGLGWVDQARSLEKQFEATKDAGVQTQLLGILTKLTDATQKSQAFINQANAALKKG